MKEPEVVEHICFVCEWTAPIWFIGCVGMRYQKEDIRRVYETLCKLFCCNNIDGDIKALIAWTCWYIWKERCKVQIGKKQLDVIGVIERIKYAFGEIRKKFSKDTIEGVGKSAVGEGNEEWKPLEEGWMKVNCDGACNPKTGKVVVGIIAKNKERKVMAGLGNVIYTEESELAEALAIKNGVKLAADKGYQKVIFESNSKNMIEGIEGRKGRCS